MGQKCARIGWKRPEMGLKGAARGGIGYPAAWSIFQRLTGKDVDLKMFSHSGGKLANLA